MKKGLKIVYREFYDVPRMLIIKHRGLKLLLDSPFDETIDEYSPTYKVYVLPDETDEHSLGSWETFPKTATKSLGEIPVDELVFDSTKRAEVDASAIDRLLDSWPDSMKLSAPSTE